MDIAVLNVLNGILQDLKNDANVRTNSGDYILKAYQLQFFSHQALDMLCTKFIMYFSSGTVLLQCCLGRYSTLAYRLGHYTYPDNTIEEQFFCEKSIIGYQYITHRNSTFSLVVSQALYFNSIIHFLTTGDYTSQQALY